MDRQEEVSQCKIMIAKDSIVKLILFILRIRSNNLISIFLLNKMKALILCSNKNYEVIAETNFEKIMIILLSLKIFSVFKKANPLASSRIIFILRESLH